MLQALVCWVKTHLRRELLTKLILSRVVLRLFFTELVELRL